MNGAPPPPPPHGGNPKTSHTNLPPGKYDVFIIPPHSAGSGFLYLPSLKPNANSFAAGFASALVLVVLCQSMAPAFKAWWSSFQGMGNMGMMLLVIAVGVGAWSLGRTQTEGGPVPGSGPSQPNGGYGHGPGSGAYPGAGGPMPNADGPPPPPPPHGSPPPPRSEGPPPNTPGGGGPKSSWQQPPESGESASTKSSWEKAREETRKKEEERKAKEAEQKRKEETARRLRELREKEARERAKREQEAKAKAAREAQERAKREQEAKEKAEREARERAKREQEAKEKAEREAREKEKQENERREREAQLEKERRELEARLEREKQEHEAQLEKERRARQELLEKERQQYEKQIQQREKEEREKEAKEKAAREKEMREARLRESRERELRERLERERALREKLEREAKEREAKNRVEEAKEAATPRKSTYAFSSVGEKTNPWPNGRPPSQPSSPITPNPPNPTPSSAKRAPAPEPAKPNPVPSPSQRAPAPEPAKPSPTPSAAKRAPAPEARTARTSTGTLDEETYSYRPYDQPKQHHRRRSGETIFTESSYAPSQSTTFTTPPASVRMTYSTKDPEKIVIKAVYCFMNQFAKTPASQLISGVGPVTDGLILRITTEGIFIDDDVRGVPQREWDVKAWTLKLMEVWCSSPSFVEPTTATTTSHSSNLLRKPRARMDRGQPKTLTGDDADAFLIDMLRVCKNECRLGPHGDDAHSFANGSQSGEWKQRGLHILRAVIRDQEGKRYLFILGEEEGWKVAAALQRLRRGTQVRQLGVQVMSPLEARGTLELLGWT